MAIHLSAKWSAVASAVGLVLSSVGIASAQLEVRVPTGGSKIELSRCTAGPTPNRPCKRDDQCGMGGTCTKVNKVDLVVNLVRLNTSTGDPISGWTPTTAQRTKLEDGFNSVNYTLAEATDGQLLIGNVTFVESNGAPSGIVQLSPGVCSGGGGILCVNSSDCPSGGNCLSGGTHVNIGEWGNNGKIRADVGCIEDSRCFAKHFLSLVGNLHDESRGKLDSDGNNLPDQCKENSSSKRCFGGPNEGDACDTNSAACTAAGTCGQIRCLDSGPGCLMEWQNNALGSGTELCFAGNHDPDRDTQQSQCHQNHSCWEQLGVEWPSVIRVATVPPIVSEPAAPTIAARFETPAFDRFVAVVDRSGSMTIVDEGQSRLQRAVNAVKDFVDMLSVNSQLGLASFSSKNGGIPGGVDATKDFPSTLGLQTINSPADRTAAKGVADVLLSRGGGGTRIGAGLRKAREMLLENGGAISINSSVLLLTDGLNNEPQQNPRADLDAALDELSTARLPVFVTCIGQARDSAQCAYMADRTSGRFVDSATTSSLYDAFLEFVAHAERQGLAQTQMNLPISQGEEAEPIPVVIEPGTREARFVISWTRLTSNLDLELIRPDGTPVSMSERIFGTQGEFYRIDNPMAGTWTMRVRGVSVPALDGSSLALATPDRFSARALIDHKEIHLDAGLARSTITWPAAFLINAAPSFGRGIEGCQAEATVQKPDGTTEVVPLLDGGEDGDNDADDGIYNALYRNFTAGEGIYTFLVRVRCEQGVAHVVNGDEPSAGGIIFDPPIPTFERTLRFSGFVTGAVPDNLPPVAKICSNVQVECKGTPMQVSLDGTCSFDPEGRPLSYMWSSPTGSFSVPTEAQPTGLFRVGYNVVQLEVADSEGVVSSPDVGVVIVADTTAPVIQSLTASPSELWAPNHSMVPVTLKAQVVEACDSNYSCQITSVTSNEPADGNGDGNTEPDWEVTGPLSLKLRQERCGNGEGRVYTVQVTCGDASSNTSTAAVTIAVKHDQGG